MVHVRRAALILLIGALLLGTVRWWRAAQTRAAAADELRIAYTGSITGLNPRSVHPPPSLSQRVADALWDELVAFDPVALAVVPRVAERWEVSEDGRRYLFRIAPGQKWSNGDLIVAEDFVRTVHWLLAQEVDHPLIRLLGDAGRARSPNQEGFGAISIRAVDPRTLEVRLKAPPPDFLPLLAAVGWIPLHATSVAKFENATWSAPDALVTNGPYRLRHFGSSEILLETNAHYAAPAAFGRVRLVRTDNALLFPTLLRAGRADFGDALNFLPEGFDSEPPGGVLEHENTASVSTLQFNVSRPPLNDARVRRALSLALDRAALARRFDGGGALPAYSFTPPGQSEDAAERTVEEDLATARRLLAEAGYPEGRGFPVLRVPFLTGPESNRLPFYCAEQWRTRLGIRVYTPELPREEMLSRARRGDFDAVHVRWVASPLDFSTLSQQVDVPLPQPFRSAAEARIAALVFEARKLQGRARLHAMLAAERALLEEMPATPVLLYHRYTLRSDRVAGWRHDIFGRHALRDFRLSGGGEGESP